MKGTVPTSPRSLAYLGGFLVVAAFGEAQVLPRLEGSAEPAVLVKAPFSWFPMGGMGGAAGLPSLPVVLGLALLAVLGIAYAASLVVAGRLKAGSGTLAVIIVIFGALGVIALLAPPARNSDIFYYAVQGRMIAREGMNPYLLPPRADSADPWFPLVSQVWRDLTTGYGPTWLLVSAAVDLISDRGPLTHDIVPTLLALRLLFIGAIAASAALIWSILGDLAPDRQVSGTIAFAWCPVLVVVGFDHNDALMVFLAILGIWLQLRGRTLLAVVLLALSALVKYYTLPLLVAELVWLWRSGPSVRTSRRILPAVVAAVTGLVVLAPFNPPALVTAFPSYLQASGRVDHVLQLPTDVLIGLLVIVGARVIGVGRLSWFDQVVGAGVIALVVYLAAFSRDLFPWYLITLLGLAALLGGGWLDATAVASAIWLIGLHGGEAYLVGVLESLLAWDRTKAIPPLFFFPSALLVAGTSLWRWRRWSNASLLTIGLVVLCLPLVDIEAPLIAHLDQPPPLADLGGGRAPGPVVFGSALEWDDWSWGVTLEQTAFADGASGNRTLCVTPTSPGGAFYAHHPGFSTRGYATLDFQVSQPNGAPPMLVDLRGTDGKDLPAVRVDEVSQPIPADPSWRMVQIPLSRLEQRDQTITGIVLHASESLPSPAFCVRDIAFR